MRGMCKQQHPSHVRDLPPLAVAAAAATASGAVLPAEPAALLCQPVLTQAKGDSAGMHVITCVCMQSMYKQQHQSHVRDLQKLEAVAAVQRFCLLGQLVCCASLSSPSGTVPCTMTCSPTGDGAAMPLDCRCSNTPCSTWRQHNLVLIHSMQCVEQSQQQSMCNQLHEPAF